MRALTLRDIALSRTPQIDPPMMTLRALPMLTRRRRLAPGGHAKINRAHPISRGIVFCFVAGKDIVGATPLPSTVVHRATTTGRGHVATATNANSTALDFVAGQAFSVLAAGQLTANSVGVDLFSRYTYVNETTNSGWNLKRSSSRVQFNCYHNVGTSIYTAQTGASSLTFGPYVAVGVLNPGVDSRVFAANQRGILTGASVGVSTEASAGLTIGSGSDGNVVSIAAAWRRNLTDSEAWQLQADPFCFLNF